MTKSGERLIKSAKQAAAMAKAPDDRITKNEMVEMFGNEMPIEAVQLLYDAPGEMTLGGVRAKLREMAAAKTPERVESDLVKDLLVSADSITQEEYWPESVLMRQAADRIQALEAELAKENQEKIKWMGLCQLAEKKHNDQLSGVHAGTHVIVPVGLTDEMIDAASKEAHSGAKGSWTQRLKEIYRAMIAASKGD